MKSSSLSISSPSPWKSRCEHGGTESQLHPAMALIKPAACGRQTSEISKINAVHFSNEDIHKNMKSLRPWSVSLPSGSCGILFFFFVKFERLRKRDGRLFSVYCKSSKNSASRQYCYKWWWTWLDLLLVGMTAIQRRLKEAQSDLILYQMLHRKTCAVLDSTVLC